jgi:3-deoxy-D-manno-octulosonic-acid transferase
MARHSNASSREIHVYNLKKTQSGSLVSSALNASLIHSNIRDFAWIAGSTHPDEEARLADVHCDVLKELKSLKLLTIVAPRHPERTPEVLDRVKERLSSNGDQVTQVVLFSQMKRWPAGPAIIIVNVLGHLAELYKYVDVAFIGGSLSASKSGFQHNVFEASSQGCRLILQGTRAPPDVDTLSILSRVRDDELTGRLVDWFGNGNSNRRKSEDRPKSPQDPDLPIVMELIRPLLVVN